MMTATFDISHFRRRCDSVTASMFDDICYALICITTQMTSTHVPLGANQVTLCTSGWCCHPELRTM
jgi:hypothetical protein